MVDAIVRMVEILLVEDNPGDARLTQELLRDAKLANQVTVIGDGETALDYLFKRNGHEDATTPDLIVLDLQLPKVGGREVLRQVREASDLQEIPIAVLTGADVDDYFLMDRAVEADCRVQKPLDGDGIMKIIAEIESFTLAIVQFADDGHHDRVAL